MEAAEGKENKRRLDGQQITASDRRGSGRAYRPPLAWVDDLQALLTARSKSALIASIKARPARERVQAESIRRFRKQASVCGIKGIFLSRLTQIKAFTNWLPHLVLTKLQTSEASHAPVHAPGR